jgi:hypothetical protein
METGRTCSDCGKKPAVSREGWCLACLRKRLDEKFGRKPYGHVGTNRTKEQRQEPEGDGNPWQENAIRAMEG